MVNYISVKDALKNLLEEYEITLKDLLDAMDEDKDSVEKSLRKVCSITQEQLEELEEELSNREINLLIFVIQAFYVANVGGIYKDILVVPLREEIMEGNKVTYQGLIKLARVLGLIRS